MQILALFDTNCQPVTTMIQIAGILANSLIFCATLLKTLKIQSDARKVGLHPRVTTVIISQGATVVSTPFSSLLCLTRFIGLLWWL